MAAILLINLLIQNQSFCWMAYASFWPFNWGHKEPPDILTCFYLGAPCVYASVRSSGNVWRREGSCLLGTDELKGLCASVPTVWFLCVVGVCALQHIFSMYVWSSLFTRLPMAGRYKVVPLVLSDLCTLNPPSSLTCHTPAPALRSHSIWYHPSSLHHTISLKSISWDEGIMCGKYHSVTFYCLSFQVAELKVIPADFTNRQLMTYTPSNT